MGAPNFWASKVTEGKSQPTHNIIKFSNLEKFWYDCYLAISAFKLPIIICSEGGEISGWRYVILESATILLT